MTRQWRIEYPGALYHVLSRGNEQRSIVLDDEDRRQFLSLVGKMCERFSMEVFAYVLMDNHYHLLLRTQQANLSKGMQWLGVTYTRQFNLKYKRSGHLFQGRFKCFLIENDAYLMQLSYYVHRNPVRAGIVKRLADYRWSSYATYAYGKDKPEWLKDEVILSQLGGRNKRAAYRKAVQQYAQEERRIWEDVRHGLFMGTDDFIKRIKAKHLTKEPHPEIPQQRRRKKEGELREVVRSATRVLGCEEHELTGRGRTKNKTLLHRDLIIYFLWDMGIFTNSEIGELFGLSYSAVSRRAAMVNDRIAKDPAIKKQADKLKSQIKM
ncbi:MAG: transposase [Proteobacteria bacterium]|nr:transposase [Pseudomonadota bacterium]